eukprot:TRINITY_DN10164_c0_g3_i1.p1 TRINITY_DN10164_c0_g3~~TRINITY_DN10164_c0_g3_i1.p1  ORF type:complete len:715 (-),score=148.34 TRINITY_DN10164_c0_g3_i1:120-2177(-)
MGGVLGCAASQLCGARSLSSSAGYAGTVTAGAADTGPSASASPGGAVASSQRSSRRQPTAQRSDRSAYLDCKAFLREQEGRASDYFRKVGDLGEGAFGDVWLARQRVNAGTAEETEGRLVAVKRVRKPYPHTGLDEDGADGEEAVEEMRTEVDLMKSLDHPSICRLLQALEDKNNLYLVMEHIDGCELFDRILDDGSFSESDAADVIHQVASALCYCHGHGVVHRDIKPENIMVVDLPDCGAASPPGGPRITVKVIDFGFGCRILEGAKLKPKVGSLVYSAPEVVAMRPCDEKQDLWSLGVVLYVLVHGELPFDGPNAKTKIKNGNFRLEGHLSAVAKDFIVQLLIVDPERRMSAAEALQHSWLSREHHVQWSKDFQIRHLDKLKAFKGESLFRQVVAGVVARQLDESLLHQLHCEFSAIDTDEDGIISIAEFKKACSELGPEGVAVFQAIDMDGSGYVDYTEFVASCIDQRIEDQEGVCWAAFQVFDADGDGYVSYDELKMVMNSANVKKTLTPGTIKKLWAQLHGQKGDGGDKTPADAVGFDSFLAAMHEARGLEASEARAARPKTPASTRARALSSPAAAGLPIATRHHAAAAAFGLPIASRSNTGASAADASSSAPPPPSRSAGAAPLLPLPGVASARPRAAAPGRPWRRPGARPGRRRACRGGRRAGRSWSRRCLTSRPR